MPCQTDRHPARYRASAHCWVQPRSPPAHSAAVTPTPRQRGAVTSAAGGAEAGARHVRGRPAPQRFVGDRLDGRRGRCQHGGIPYNDQRISKYLSLVLRHHPERVGVTLDPAGWADVDDLIAASRRAGVPLDRAVLERIVADNDKRRFAFSDDGGRIRANQGHSIPVDLGLEPLVPPGRLWHGTAESRLDAIRSEGLSPQSRQHVHLSGDHDTAVAVGRRHGKPVVLTVHAGALHRAGHRFYRSENGVWLTDAVPPDYLDIPGD